MIYTTESGQTIIDIAIEKYGCYEGVFIILQDNPTLFLGCNLKPLQRVLLRDDVPVFTDNNIAIAQYFADKNIKVNSGFKPATNPSGGDFNDNDFTTSDYN